MSSTPRLKRARSARRIISLLIDTGRPWDADWRFRITTPLALIGPGSVVLAGIIFGTQHQVLSTNYGVNGLSFLIALLTGASIVVVRYQAVIGWLLWLASTGWVAATAVSQSGDPWPVTAPGIIALLVILLGVARDRRPLIGVAVWVTTVLLGFLVGQQVDGTTARENLTLIGLLSLAAMLLGGIIRSTRRARERVATEERLTAEERGRRRILEERTRIARELHDVVAHHMSVITVQATTAAYRLPELSPEAVTEFDSIGDQARESLTELRRLLTVLRDEDTDAVREPQPGLNRLDGLTESMRRAGTAITLDVGDVGDLSEALSLTGYRIVQEALSNVVRHAPGAPVDVTVDSSPETIAITVVNGPSSSGPSTTPTEGGLGLAGMRERVKLLGGRLEAAPGPDGGFVVHAELPHNRTEQE